MALAVFATLFLLSLAAFFYARRGRKIDDHPLCRKCGFDLTGRPVESDRCPECGQRLSPNTVRIGHRQPRRRLSAIAVMLLLISFTGGLLASSRFGFNWYHHVPLGYALFRVRSTDAAARQSALEELNYRLRFGRLNDVQRGNIVDALIACQNDPKQPWHNEFLAFTANAWASQQISRSQWERYVDSLIAQATLRSGDRRSAPAIQLAMVPDATVTPSQQEKLIDALLAYQGDTGTPWHDHVGTTIERFRAAGRVTDTQWQRYASQGWAGIFAIRIRDKVRSGDPLPCQRDQTLPPARVAAVSSLWARIPATSSISKPATSNTL